MKELRILTAWPYVYTINHTYPAPGRGYCNCINTNGLQRKISEIKLDKRQYVWYTYTSHKVTKTGATQVIKSAKTGYINLQGQRIEVVSGGLVLVTLHAKEVR